jgi:hypothetical protein
MLASSRSRARSRSPMQSSSSSSRSRTSCAQPPQLFADRYVLINERASGSQGVVNFARDRSTASTCTRSSAALWTPRCLAASSCSHRDLAKTLLALACLSVASANRARCECTRPCICGSTRRFFLVRNEFEEEAALYRNPVLQKVLPEIKHANANADSTVRSQSGYAFPPYFVRSGCPARLLCVVWRPQECL